MSTSNVKAWWTNLIGLLVVVLTVFQGMLGTDMVPKMNTATLSIVSASVMFGVVVFTAIKQYLSEEIANKAVKRTLIILAIAIVGGANDFFQVINFGEIANQWIRFFITGIATILNVYSKQLFPTPDTKTKF